MEQFICIGCQTTMATNKKGEEVMSPSPCPGIMCETGHCTKHNKACEKGESCRPSVVCKFMIRKIAKEEQSVDPDESKIEKWNMLYCGNKDKKKCMGCTKKLPFIDNI